MMTKDRGTVKPKGGLIDILWSIIRIAGYHNYDYGSIKIDVVKRAV